MNQALSGIRIIDIIESFDLAIQSRRTGCDTDGEWRLATHTGSSLRLPSTAGLSHLAVVRIAIGLTG